MPSVGAGVAGSRSNRRPEFIGDMSDGASLERRQSRHRFLPVECQAPVEFCQRPPTGRPRVVRVRRDLLIVPEHPLSDHTERREGIGGQKGVVAQSGADESAVEKGKP